MGRKIQTIGRYVMDAHTLGKGNFARVELATHSVTGCKVAIKIIDTRKIKEDYIRQNLNREARILGQLRHPNIIRLYETLKATTLYCLVTEYAGGLELLAYIKTHRDYRLPEDKSRPFIRQMVSALHYLHERGVSHRDLKMENIMLDEKKKNIKIVDFGLSNTYSRDTLMKTHCGSPEYAAPELFIVGGKYGPEIDIWSLGVIMYAMLCGKLPFTTPYTDQYRRQKIQQQVEKGLVEQHDKEMSHLSQECQDLLHKLIEPSPDLRLPVLDIEIHSWITFGAKLPFYPFQSLVRDRNMKTQVMEELSGLLDVKKEQIEKSVHEKHCDDISAMFNLLMDKKRGEQGIFELDFTSKQEITETKVKSRPKKPKSALSKHEKKGKKVPPALVLSTITVDPPDDQAASHEAAKTSANFDFLALCSAPTWLGPERRRSRRRSKSPSAMSPSPSPVCLDELADKTSLATTTTPYNVGSQQQVEFKRSSSSRETDEVLKIDKTKFGNDAAAVRGHDSHSRNSSLKKKHLTKDHLSKDHLSGSSNLLSPNDACMSRLPLPNESGGLKRSHSLRGSYHRRPSSCGAARRTSFAKNKAASIDTHHIGRVSSTDNVDGIVNSLQVKVDTKPIELLEPIVKEKRQNVMSRPVNLGVKECYSLIPPSKPVCELLPPQNGPLVPTFQLEPHKTESDSLTVENNLSENVIKSPSNDTQICKQNQSVSESVSTCSNSGANAVEKQFDSKDKISLVQNSVVRPKGSVLQNVPSASTCLNSGVRLQTQSTCNELPLFDKLNICDSGTESLGSLVESMQLRGNNLNLSDDEKLQTSEKRRTLSRTDSEKERAQKFSDIQVVDLEDDVLESNVDILNGESLVTFTNAELKQLTSLSENEHTEDELPSYESVMRHGPNFGSKEQTFAEKFNCNSSTDMYGVEQATNICDPPSSDTSDGFDKPESKSKVSKPLRTGSGRSSHSGRFHRQSSSRKLRTPTSPNRQILKIPIARIESFHSDDFDFYTDDHRKTPTPSPSVTSIKSPTVPCFAYKLHTTKKKIAKLKSSKCKSQTTNSKCNSNYARSGVYTPVPDNSMRLEPLLTDTLMSSGSDGSDKQSDDVIEKVAPGGAKVHPMNKDDQDTDLSVKGVSKIPRSVGNKVAKPQQVQCFCGKPEHFPLFFHEVMEAILKKVGITLREQSQLIVFMIHCFNSLEVDLVRDQIQRLVSLPIWINLLPGRRDQLFKANPKYKKFFLLIKKNDTKLDEKQREKVQFEREFLSKLIDKYYGIINSVTDKGKVCKDTVFFSERFMELMIDIEAQLPTRRFFNAVMDNAHLVVRSQMSELAKQEEGKLFTQLLDMLKIYADFEIDEITGEALTIHDRIDIHYNRVQALQKAVFKHYQDDLESFALSNVASIDSREALLKHFKSLSNFDLQKILALLNYLPMPEEGKEEEFSTDFLLELLVSKHEKRPSQLEVINEMPLYPTEKIIWDENTVPVEYFSGDGCLALPKLNLQFLTLHDYLLRNFNLFRLESTYEIRQDIEDAVTHLKPWKAEDDSCLFGGWARMAQPISGFNVVEVAKPRVGENHPAQVRADITVQLSVRDEIKSEWEGLRKHDVAFLMSLKPSVEIGYQYKPNEPFIPQVGLVYVRGCEIEGMLDNEGKVIEEGPEPKPELQGDTRTFRVWLDPNQYQQDMTRTVSGEEDVYETFNVIMRRKPKENNFKAVLETIRDLMNTDCVVPEWLHDLVLGYGNPDAAHYSKMENQINRMDWNDTFLAIDHLKTSFPEKSIDIANNREPKPPFRLVFPVDKATTKRKADEEEPSKSQETIAVEPHVIPNRGPYPYSCPRKNAVPFTPTQVEAIKAGMHPGLTMVVGPPGTGKTDVAVQIISNIYHNFPDQRTLIVTHSNQALNQLFEKIMALDIDERHLLRLGHGEEALETEKDFSRYGRVNYVLAQRLELLQEVKRLQESLKVSSDMSYTCETAGYFYLYQVLSRWEEFISKIRAAKLKQQEDIVKKIKEFFPFAKFFENAPQPMFKGRSYEEDMDIAEGCFRHIKKMFTQLEEFMAFELLRSGSDRADYLLIKEAKIIAMTCTHAALKRRDLVNVGFKFDNILMEEAAQILEIETFIPLLLQNPEDRINRLKRWIMIGDHHQLPPVIKNMAFQKYSNMEQSLFTRFVRLGVPTVDLDAQGRSRSGIASLYNWRYKKLGSLPHVLEKPEYKTANTGFLYDYQLIDVPDYNGVGESEPNPFFYQNLAEAEYVVAVFMYMRLLGYPAEKISILTTYNGQKHLIRDVISQRCGGNPFIGRPHKVTTVDRYQGQQNDYILLSLVRTRTVGHLRDVRRLVVAMSRARLGLYIFGRVSLFSNCFELTPAFNRLTSRPLQINLLPSEAYPTRRKEGDRLPETPAVMHDMPQMAEFVFELYDTKIRRLMAQQGMSQHSGLKAPKFHKR